ncbi:Protein of unknown function [Pyronema omphalodes CBS 100304]|uniref:Uncharacterized protein n=1 Tax=Pyronema omphalodes (strain CBS 100304) TaxID=1076935 RepID=U4LT38_PYROM|nr:Protein of unknown function [Pyronema omphalodes CBS 100304]
MLSPRGFKPRNLKSLSGVKLVAQL